MTQHTKAANDKPTPKATQRIPSRSCRRVTTIDDRIRVGNRVVGEAIVLVVDLRDPFLRPIDVSWQVAQAIFVGWAASDASQWDDGVIEDPSDVRWRRGA